MEQRLRELYPNLTILCNRTDAINAELDIYFPELKLAFELNGIFHYEPVYGPEKLASMQTNDHRKFAACSERGISLCVIDTSSMMHFKPAKAQQYLSIVTNTVNTRVDELTSAGVSVESTDPTRGRKDDYMESPPQYHFRGAIALEQALQWSREIESGEAIRADIARRENVSPAHITRQLSLTKLPEDIQHALLSRDPKYGKFTAIDGIRLAKTISP